MRRYEIQTAAGTGWSYYSQTDLELQAKTMRAEAARHGHKARIWDNLTKTVVDHESIVRVTLAAFTVAQQALIVVLKQRVRYELGTAGDRQIRAQLKREHGIQLSARELIEVTEQMRHTLRCAIGESIADAAERHGL